jgi:hypothetical protein
MQPCVCILLPSALSFLSAEESYRFADKTLKDSGAKMVGALLGATIQKAQKKDQSNLTATSHSEAPTSLHPMKMTATVKSVTRSTPMMPAHMEMIQKLTVKPVWTVKNWSSGLKRKTRKRNGRTTSLQKERAARPKERLHHLHLDSRRND